jgi:hypothetical protein
MPPPDKTKEDRLKETIRILKQLVELGYSDADIGYKDVKSIMTTWVNDGKGIATKVYFTRQGRIADISLPKRADKTATLHLKVDRELLKEAEAEAKAEAEAL